MGWHALLAVIASAGLVALLVQLAGAAAFWAQAAAIQWTWIVVAGGLSLLLPVLRALRFVSAMPRVPMVLMTAVVGVQNFMARIMPFRAGELALPYLLAKHSAETSERSLVLLIWLRLMDAWFLAGVFAIGLVLHVSDANQALFWYAIGAFGVFSVALFWLGRGLRWLFRCLAVCAGVVGLDRVERVERFLADSMNAADAVDDLGLGQRGAAVVWTMAVWALQFVIFATILFAYTVEVTPLDVVVGVSLAQLAAALPLPSVGSVGTHEVGWVVGFGFVGVERTAAVVTGVAAQLFTLVFAGVVASIAWLYLRRDRPAVGVTS